MTTESNQKVITFFNNLLGFEQVAIGGYDTAIDGFKNEYPAISEKLAEFRKDHERHVSELRAIVARAGGAPRSLPAVDVVFKKPMMELRKLIGGSKLMYGMVQNEESAVTQYDWAINEAIQMGLSQDHIDVLKRALDDEKRHFTYVEQQYHSLELGTKVDMGAETQPKVAEGQHLRTDRSNKKTK
jgi:hypothetical protein